MLVLALSTTAGAGPAWPPFLPPPDDVAQSLVPRIEKVWTHPTLTRTVTGGRAEVPFDIYTAFVDSPVVTASAARHLGLAKYTVQRLGDDAYEADDGNGARGTYHVLVREPNRRVILSTGEHNGYILGTVRGSALTILEFKPAEDGVDQELTTYVHIDNSAAAALARVLITVFGSIADRKLSEGFAVTTKVARWSVEQPDEFCAWLSRADLPEDGVSRVVSAARQCSVAALTQPRR